MNTRQLLGMNLRKSLLPVDIIMYNLYSEDWWKGQVALLTKTYHNFSGNVIEENSWVEIQFLLQEKRFGTYMLHGMFYVRDLTGVEIGGIECQDLLLLDKKLLGNLDTLRN